MTPKRERDADGYQRIWDWPPWARFLGARAQLIHEALAEGKSPAEIREWLSMDEVQVRLIGATDLASIPGIPGNVWPPKQFQKPARATRDAPLPSLARAAASTAVLEARAILRKNGGTAKQDAALLALERRYHDAKKAAPQPRSAKTRALASKRPAAKKAKRKQRRRG